MSLVQAPGTEGQDMEPSLSAPAAMVISPIIQATDGHHLGMDRAMPSSPGEPQGGEPRAVQPQTSGKAAPFVIITEPSGGEM